MGFRGIWIQLSSVARQKAFSLSAREADHIKAGRGAPSGASLTAGPARADTKK
jgi:hypothetical protein